VPPAGTIMQPIGMMHYLHNPVYNYIHWVPYSEAGLLELRKSLLYRKHSVSVPYGRRSRNYGRIQRGPLEQENEEMFFKVLSADPVAQYYYLVMFKHQLLNSGLAPFWAYA
jgi:hypothetical protein